MRAVVFVMLAACADLPDLGVCGNGVIEATNGEACDGDTSGADTCTDTCELSCQTTAVAGYVSVGVDPSTRTEQFCPDPEMRCGLDTICRASSGTFGAIEANQPFDVRSASTGDFDGDLVTDIVGTSATQLVVRFGSTSTPFSDGFAQDAPSSESPAAIFDREPGTVAVDRSDLGIAIPTDGIALLSSDTETFTPELDVTVTIDDASFLHFVVEDPNQTLMPPLGDVVMRATRSGTISVQRVVPSVQTLGACGGAGSTLVGVAVSRDRRAFVVVGRPSTGLGWFACVYRPVGNSFSAPVIATFANVPAPTTVLLADITGDACPELVVARPVGTPPNVTTAINFIGNSPGCTLALTISSFTVATLAGENALLGSGGIEPGGGDELVLSTAVLRVTATLDLELLARPTVDTRPWTTAAVIDLNGDGVLDVVAGRQAQDDVDVVRGGAPPNVYRADTTSPVVATVAGDFDGDFLGDVALVERAIGDRVSILYGSADGLVGPPIPNSRSEGVLRIERLRSFTWADTIRDNDGVEDLLVTRISGSDMRAGVLFGDAPRLLTMPRLAPDPRTIIGLAVGSFGPSVLAVAVRTSNELFTLDLATGVSTPPVVMPFAIDGTVPLQIVRTAGPPLLAGLVPGPMGASMLGLFDPAGGGCTQPVESRPFSLRAADLANNDGRDELVFVAQPMPGGTRRVRVFEVVTPCAFGPELFAAELGQCSDVVRANNTLVALCEFGPRLFGVFRLGEAGLEKVADIDGVGLQLVVGDFDGDSLDDVAVGTIRAGEVGVQVLRQCPAHDTRDCK